MGNDISSAVEPRAARRLISLKKAAALVDVEPRTIRNWITAGQIRGYKLGQMWRVDREEVLDLAQLVVFGSAGGAA